LWNRDKEGEALKKEMERLGEVQKLLFPDKKKAEMRRNYLEAVKAETKVNPIVDEVSGLPLKNRRREKS